MISWNTTKDTISRYFNKKSNKKKKIKEIARQNTLTQTTPVNILERQTKQLTLQKESIETDMSELPFKPKQIKKIKRRKKEKPKKPEKNDDTMITVNELQQLMEFVSITKEEIFKLKKENKKLKTTNKKLKETITDINQKSNQFVRMKSVKKNESVDRTKKARSKSYDRSKSRSKSVYRPKLKTVKTTKKSKKPKTRFSTSVRSCNFSNKKISRQLYKSRSRNASMVKSKQGGTLSDRIDNLIYRLEDLIA